MSGRIYVCETCIEDPALQEVVRQNAISEQCDYCNRRAKSPLACELSYIVDRIRFAIEQEYNDPNNELPIDDGEFCGVVYHGSEVFDSIGFYVENEQLQSDLCDVFIDDSFCRRDYYEPTPDHIFGAAWRRYKEVVQTKRRYTFWNSIEEGEFNDPAYGIPAGKMLSFLTGRISQLSPVTTLPVGTAMWRVRVHDVDKPLTNPQDFTSPPLKYATQANRMSPAGVPMFYGAEDLRTASLETLEPDRMKGKIATGAKFVTQVRLNVLDLTADYRPISFFVDWDRERRHAVEFLHAFATDLSRPIKRDDRQHIEYVPTQVFTEYVRFELSAKSDQPFHGIKYPSSQNGKSCFVIFAEQADCLPSRDSSVRPQLLRFVKGSLRIIKKQVAGPRTMKKPRR